MGPRFGAHSTSFCRTEVDAIDRAEVYAAHSEGASPCQMPKILLDAGTS